LDSGYHSLVRDQRTIIQALALISSGLTMIANHALLPSINLRVKPVHHRSCVVAAASPSVTTQQSPQAFKPEKPTLFDVPISNE